MVEQVLQRCVFPDDPGLAPLYYRLTDGLAAQREDGPVPNRFGIGVPAGWTLTTDTYLNSLFEGYWRRYTRVVRLALRLEVRGSGTIQLFRRIAGQAPQPLRAAWFSDLAEPITLECPVPALPEEEHAAVYFALSSHGAETRLEKATWIAVEVAAEPVRLALGICAFNRAPQVIANLEKLFDDADLSPLLARVFVVDQGTSPVRRHPGFARLKRTADGRVRVVTQGNYGGAGGFTRAILEARAERTATHMLLMDDDARVEPESVLRAARFLALARKPLAVGGPMLDLLQPTELHEAGTRLRPHRLGITRSFHRQCVRDLSAVPDLLRATEPDYNSWWFFAFPLAVLDRVGLPLPVFIRGDDAEFGWRLRCRGVPTVTVPGFAVWHEPSYLKRSGWHPYYDLRNMLILTAVHHPQPWYRVAAAFLKRLLGRLLCCNYYQATLVCEALDDYCRGPRVVQADPRTIHQRLLTLQTRLGPKPAVDNSPLQTVSPAPAPASRSAAVWRMLCGLGRQLFRRSPPPDQPMRRIIPEADAGWWSLSTADVVGVRDGQSGQVTVHRRSRILFALLLWRALGSMMRLARVNRRVGLAWRAGFPRLIRVGFWKRYLRLGQPTRVGQRGGRSSRTRPAGKRLSPGFVNEVS